MKHVAAPPSHIDSIINRSNLVTLQGLGLPNLTYLIQANTSLATTNWKTLAGVQADAAGAFTYFDPVFGVPIRFYRVLSP